MKNLFGINNEENNFNKFMAWSIVYSRNASSKRWF